jgi:hypothetical protein
MRQGRRCPEAGLFRSKPRFPPVFRKSSSGMLKTVNLPNQQAFSNVKSRGLTQQETFLQ